MSRTDRATRAAAALAIAAALCVTVAGCGFVHASQKSDTKPGGFVLLGHANVPLAPTATPTVGAACTAAAPYADVAEHTQVTVTNAAGKKVATGALSAGVYVTVASAVVCEFPFTIRAVPDGSDVYNVAVGNRPAQPFQAADLRTNTPAIITIGSGTP